MIINDEIYGEEEITEPVLLDLINSKTLQRLKGISQMGMPQEYYHKPIYSRYDHSMGVLVLLKKLNACLDEQVAGLIHDISHTAFSHVVDWVVGDPTKEDYQDNIFLNFLENSELPPILKKHRFDYKNFSNLEDFSLLEKEAPSLCVDRFDYSIREISWNGNGLVKIIVNDLKNYKGNLVFNSKDVAESFARGYTNCQAKHWAGNEAKARYYILAGVLRKAISKEIISIKDLSEFEDEYIIKLLREKGDEYILDNLDLLRNGFLVEETNSQGGIVLKKKFRYVDPEVLFNGGVVKLSEVSSDYKILLEELKQNSKLENRVFIYKNKMDTNE